MTLRNNKWEVNVHQQISAPNRSAHATLNSLLPIFRPNEDIGMALSQSEECSDDMARSRAFELPEVDLSIKLPKIDSPTGPSQLSCLAISLGFCDSSILNLECQSSSASTI